MEQKKKPRYNMWQNSAYMIGLAWGSYKSVVLLCIAEVVAAIALNLTKLLVTPSLLAAVETHVPMTELLTTIIGFTGLLILFQAAER